MKKGNPAPLPPELLAELRALEVLGDDSIDYSDAPEVKDWSGAVRGRFATRTRNVTVRLDAEVVAYFEQRGAEGMNEINAVLREWLAQHRPAA